MIPATFLKAAHQVGCRGELYNDKRVFIDVVGRVGNGGNVAYDYRCNDRWNGCPARVLVSETAMRAIAVAAEVRR